MDLFNRKKVKELQNKVIELEKKNYSLAEDIDGYVRNERHWNSQIDGLEKISSQTMEENQKLIKWIETILNTVGVMEVREKRQIQIPVYIDKSIRAYDSNYMGIFERERITIPEITIVKMG